MHKVYIKDTVFIEAKVKEKLISEMSKRKTGFKEVLNSVLKEYFEIKEILRSEDN